MLAALEVALFSYDLTIYAVLDGAIYPNFYDFLNDNGLTARSLFKNTAPKDLIAAGPWLFEIPRKNLVAMLHVFSEYGGAVFWLSSYEGGIVYSHLRKLNAAKMPDGRIVYFRHYDPDVLGSIIVMLDAKQAAQLFGPTQCIGFVGGRANGATVSKPDGLPPPERGPIVFYDWQIGKLDERQWEISRSRVCAMLREQLPMCTRHFSADQLDVLVQGSQQDARVRGLTTELSLAYWCYLDFASQGKIRDNIVANQALSVSNDSAGHKLSADDALLRNFASLRDRFAATLGKVQ